MLYPGPSTSPGHCHGLGPGSGPGLVLGPYQSPGESPVSCSSPGSNLGPGSV